MVNESLGWVIVVRNQCVDLAEMCSGFKGNSLRLTDRCEVKRNARGCTYISLIIEIELKEESHYPVREREECRLGWRCGKSKIAR